MADENARYHMGWDSFTPNPGKWQSHRCRACGEELLVERNVTGRRSWIGSNDAKFDHFYCRHSQNEWHLRAIELHKAIAKMPSVTVADMMRRDLDDILCRVDHDSRSHAMAGASKPYKPSIFD